MPQADGLVRTLFTLANVADAGTPTAIVFVAVAGPVPLSTINWSV